MLLLSVTLLVSVLWFSQSVHPSNITARDVTTHSFTKRKSLPGDLSYNQFQISDGTAGNCQNLAAGIFLTGYGLDQNTLVGQNPQFNVKLDKKVDLRNCNKMTKAAVSAEADFNKAIASKGNNQALVNELQNGKICNKVLKLTGTVLCLQMEVNLGIANSERRIKLADEITKLKKNIDIDSKAKGQKMRSFLKVNS